MRRGPKAQLATTYRKSQPFKLSPVISGRGEKANGADQRNAARAKLWRDECYPHDREVAVGEKRERIVFYRQQLTLPPHTFLYSTQLGQRSWKNHVKGTRLTAVYTCRTASGRRIYVPYSRRVTVSKHNCKSTFPLKPKVNLI